MINEVENLSSSPDYEKAQEFISKLVKDYEEGRTDKIILVYNGYVNMITQEVVELQLLPVDSSKVVSNSVSMSELEVEPDDDDTLVEELTKKYIDYSMYYSLLNSLASEHSGKNGRRWMLLQIMQKRIGEENLQ